MINKGKKGELTTSELIGIIILIASVAIIIYVYFQLNWIGQVDSTVCHESVILRGTLPNVAEIKTLAPLKCKTDKICIRGNKFLFGKGNCEVDYANTKDVTNVDVSDINEVNQAVAQEMYSCWKMMGEGKISLFDSSAANKFGAGNIYSSCVICSRFAFDDATLAEKGVDLSKLNIDNYMKTHKAPNQNVSYYDYFAGQNGKVSVGENVNLNNIEVTTINGNNTNATILSLENLQARSRNKTDEIAVLFMQVSAPSGTDVWKNTLSLVGIGWGASFVKNPLTTLETTTSVVFNPASWVIGVLLFGAQQLNTWSNQNVAAGYCGDVSYGKDARSGCSVVRLVNYNLNDLSQYCSKIESIS